MLKSHGGRAPGPIRASCRCTPRPASVLYVPMKHVDGAAGEITFDDEDGREWTLPVTGGQGEAAVEARFRRALGGAGVDFEMYGKDHSGQHPIYDGICAFGWRPPEHFVLRVVPGRERRKDLQIQGQWHFGRGMADLCADGIAFAVPVPQTRELRKSSISTSFPRPWMNTTSSCAPFPGQTPDQQAANPVWHIMAGRCRAPAWWLVSRCY